MFNKFLKRSRNGTNLGLEHTSSMSSSIYTNEPSSKSTSPEESNFDPLSAEPEVLPSPVERSATRKKVMWPRDLLPDDLPNARIFTFGYDADLVSGLNSTAGAKLTFIQYSNELFAALDQELDNEVS
jgi:hypothetical protein